MNDRYNHDELSADLDTFLDWVNQTAENEGTSPDTVIQQLMSTYWILKELTETLEESPYEHLIGQDTDVDEDREIPESARDERAARGDSANEIADIVKAIAEMNNQPRSVEPEPASGTIDPGLIDVIEAIQQQSPPPASPDRSNVHLASQLERVRERVSSLSRDIEDVDGRIDGVHERIERDVGGITDRVESVESTAAGLDDRIDEIAERNKAELANLAESVDELETTVEQKVDHEAIDSLESLADREFDAIERAFKQLLGSLDDTESELGSAIQSNAEDLERLRKHHEEQQRLGKLKHEAMRRKIDEAVCENCSQSIEFGLLSSPYCPNCDRTLSSIESGGWNPFKSARVTTKPIRSVASSSASDPTP